MSKINLFDAKDAREATLKSTKEIRDKELNRIIDMPTKEKELVDKIISYIEISAAMGKFNAIISHKDVPELKDIDTAYCIESLLEILGFDTKTQVKETLHPRLFRKIIREVTLTISWSNEDMQKALIDQYETLEKLKTDAAQMRNRKK